MTERFGSAPDPQEPKLSPDKAFEKEAREWLTGLTSLEELERQVGDITPEERQLLADADVDFDREPTEEEIRQFDIDFPSFTDRVINNVMKRIATEPQGGITNITKGNPK